MKTRVLALTTLAMLAGPVFADIDGGAVLGGAIGGGAGAAVGSAVGGRNGAIVGGAVGGAAGAAIGADKPREKTVVKKEVIYVYPERHDNGLHRGHYKNKKKHHRDD